MIKNVKLRGHIYWIGPDPNVEDEDDKDKDEGDDGIDDDPVLWNVKAPKGSNLVGFISLKSL